MHRKNHHHLNLVCDVSELAALLAGSENIENFLQRTVEMVGRHMNANVCSIYLLEEMDGKDVTIRTLDLGGDKLLAYSDTKGETDPDLGLRAIRFSFRHRDIFHQQATFGDHA